MQGPIMDAILKGQMGFINKGKHLISRVYISDLVQGLCRALEFGKGGDAYNIASGGKDKLAGMGGRNCQRTGRKDSQNLRALLGGDYNCFDYGRGMQTL